MERVVSYRGNLWKIGEPVRTSDGYLIANGFMLDPDTQEPVVDEEGLAVIHSFFLGSAGD